VYFKGFRMTLDTTPQRSVIWIAQTLKTAGTRTDFLRCLQDICRASGAKHASFVMRHVPGIVEDDPFVVDTYSEAWRQNASEQRYEFVDPVMIFNDYSGAPTDWANLPKNKTRLRKFFRDFAEFSLGRQAITATYRGPQGDRSLLTFSVDASEKRWPTIKQDLCAAAAIIHPALHRAILKVRFQLSDANAVRLTPREKECLVWAAHGNTSKAIGESLGLTPATVNFFIDAAVVKLSAANRAHAAAKAVALGLIAPPL
jgi:DNA-binding CsgD family transcriptional regulator